MLIVRAFAEEILRNTEVLHRRRALFQQFQAFGGNLDNRVHIVKVLVIAVHAVFEVEPCADGTVQFFIIRAGVANIAHTGTVYHGCL